MKPNSRHTVRALGGMCWARRTVRSVTSHLAESLGRPRAVRGQTSGKLEEEQKLWVTATQRSRLSTACHQPAGTKMTSPGRCTAFSGCAAGHPGCCVRGHTLRNHAAPSRGTPAGRTTCTRAYAHQVIRVWTSCECSAAVPAVRCQLRAAECRRWLHGLLTGKGRAFSSAW